MKYPKNNIKTPTVENKGHLKRGSSCLQFMCAVRGFVHAVSFLQQLEELFNRDTRVRGAAQREDLPHQYAKRPPEHR